MIPGATFMMGRSASGTDAFSSADEPAEPFFPDLSAEAPEHAATVGTYYLDRFEVTVGRMRAFAEQYTGILPAASDGTSIVAVGESWNKVWDSQLPADQAALLARLNCQYTTYTATPGANESTAMNCIDFYVAYAFCIWDGGRLPTEAEWELAAAAGTENRLFPWGATIPNNAADCGPNLVNGWNCGAKVMLPVGSFPLGASKYGPLDMSGNALEWTFDQHIPYDLSGAACNECIVSAAAFEAHVVRGGAIYSSHPSYFRAAARNYWNPSFYNSNTGFRCAYDTQ
jgi:formylglycine-generating enzyme